MEIYVIIAITVIVSLLCFKNRALFYKLSLSPYMVTHKKEWYRVITHAFVHADTTHLLVNMLVLWSFGFSILSSFSFNGIGELVPFLILYFGGVIFSSIPDLTKQKNNAMYNSIGASGGVSAVLFATILFNPWGLIYIFGIIPIPSIIFAIFYLWYETQGAKKMGGRINHQAHIYGAIYGFLMPLLFKPSLISEFIKELVRL